MSHAMEISKHDDASTGIIEVEDASIQSLEVKVVSEAGRSI